MGSATNTAAHSIMNFRGPFVYTFARSLGATIHQLASLLLLASVEGQPDTRMGSFNHGSAKLRLRLETFP